VLFALMANRALAIEARRSRVRQLRGTRPGPPADGGGPGLPGDGPAATADARGWVQEAVFFAVADPLNLEVPFFDTTSTYFERGDPSTEPTAGRALARSRIPRTTAPDLPQVEIGLAVPEGDPVRVWVWPGNTNDQTVIRQVKDGSRVGGWAGVWFVDRGFHAVENLRYLTRAGGHRTAGEGMRGGLPPGPLPHGQRQPAAQGGEAGPRATPCCASSASTTPPRQAATAASAEQ
jgi:hypothetical protein